MKKKYQNAFFIFGIVVLAVMITQLPFKQVWEGLQHAGYWFFAVVGLWFFLYLFNTAAWYIIIKAQKQHSQPATATAQDNSNGQATNSPGKETTTEATAAATAKHGDTVADGRRKNVTFFWLYKVTISGFALNYATPGGLMGGEPYRIMALSPRIGTERASSSVILYVMTHIFSHFWFWLICSVLFILLRHVTFLTGVMLAVVIGICLLAIWFS